MQMTYPERMKLVVGRFLLAVGRPLSVFDACIAMPAYFRLRKDIVSGMPWTIGNLHPSITPYIPGERLLKNGYTAALIQTNGFNVIIYRQSQQNVNDDSFSIASPCFPQQHFAFGVTEAAIVELEGAEKPRVRRYDSMPDVDLSLRELSPLLRKHLTCELFSETKAVIDRILKEGMIQATRVKHP